MMVLPDYSSGNNEKDIHVKNFNINVGGLELLDCADLKLSHGRKVRHAHAFYRLLWFQVLQCAAPMPVDVPAVNMEPPLRSCTVGLHPRRRQSIFYSNLDTM